MRVQIHFKDPRNKRLDISHQLKLDWTQTGLQTFGGESFKDTQLIIKPNDFKSSDLKASQERPAITITLPNKHIESIVYADSEENNNNSNNESVSSPSSSKPCMGEIVNINSNLVTHEMSPSSFISTEHFLPTPQKTSTNTNLTASACFDELIHNFCSNAESTHASKDSLSQAAASTPPKVGLDDLLNLRPKSIVSNAQQQPLATTSLTTELSNKQNSLINKITLVKPAFAISKVVKTFNASPLSLATFKPINIASLPQKEDLLRKLIPVSKFDVLASKLNTASSFMENAESVKKSAATSRLSLNGNKADMVIYKVDSSDIKDLNEKTTSSFNLDLSNSGLLVNEAKNAVKKSVSY